MKHFPSRFRRARPLTRPPREPLKNSGLPGRTTEIIYEDKKGHWHDEQSKGSDRPETGVED